MIPKAAAKCPAYVMSIVARRLPFKFRVYVHIYIYVCIYVYIYICVCEMSTQIHAAYNISYILRIHQYTTH